MRWLGFDWGEHLYYASDYFERLYQLALVLIRRGKAYVDDLSEEAIREFRGSLDREGPRQPASRPLRWRRTSIFSPACGRASSRPARRCLRAKIDMGAANMKMRDPLLYRIKKAHHYRTGDQWCIYPFYDYAHPLSDAIEKVTHSLCSLEFENNRELYDWVVRETEIDATPRQIEFARLNLTYTILSKRKLLVLVERRPRGRLGRSAHADDLRLPPPRLHPRGDPRLSPSGSASPAPTT